MEKFHHGETIQRYFQNVGNGVKPALRAVIRFIPSVFFDTSPRTPPLTRAVIRSRALLRSRSAGLQSLPPPRPRGRVHEGACIRTRPRLPPSAASVSTGQAPPRGLLLALNQTKMRHQRPTPRRCTGRTAGAARHGDSYLLDDTRGGLSSCRRGSVQPRRARRPGEGEGELLLGADRENCCREWTRASCLRCCRSWPRWPRCHVALVLRSMIAF